MQLSEEQKSAIRRDNKQFENLGGQTFADFIQEQVLNLLEAGAVGITADARYVNAVAVAGVVATRDKTTAPGTTLSFAWYAFRVYKGKSLVTVPAGNLMLDASTTNYVEADVTTLTVSVNTVGFTAGRVPMFTVVTAAGSYADANVVSMATVYSAPGPGGLDGSLLSTAGKTKEVQAQFPDPIATAAGATTLRVVVPKSIAVASKLTNVRVVTRDGLVASDVNYVTFGLVNKGAAGAGAQVLVDAAAAANSTKATGGSALAADVPRDLTLATLTVGTERDVTGGDVLVFTITAAGVLPNTLREFVLLLEFTFTN